MVVINPATSVCCRYYSRFAALGGERLALSMSDDEFGTGESIQRFLGYYRSSTRVHLHLPPDAVGQKQVGHFAFFHSRFEHSLWRIPLTWLRHGRLPTQPRGEVITLEAESPSRRYPPLAVARPA